MQRAEPSGLHRGVSRQAETGERERGQNGPESPMFAGAKLERRGQDGAKRETRLPEPTERGVKEDALERFGGPSAGPVVGHCRRFQREPEDRAEQDDKACDEDDGPQVERERATKGVRREQPEVCARPERDHRGQEMREAAERERGLHGLATASSRCGAGVRERRHIFIPPMSSFLGLPPPDAPTPCTANSTGIAPACSNVSVAFATTPFPRGCFTPVNMR